jgi:hypothetical protein
MMTSVEAAKGTLIFCHSDPFQQQKMVDRHAATLYDFLNSLEAESDQIVALIRISKAAKCNMFGHGS